MRVIAAVLLASIAFGVNAATVPSGAAPNITGTWQGTLHFPGGGLRTVFQISRASGGWQATMYSIDENLDPIPVTAITLSGSMLTIDVDSLRGSYRGTVSADGSAIIGTWTQRRPVSLDFKRATAATAWPLYNTGYKVRFVTVEPGVKLEVLDWGGSGRPVILLAGQGNTAHVFDRFAPKLTAWYHVYGITRRGYGLSSAPTTGYSADRLGQDVLAVMDELKIQRPVLIGHSLAGEELSDVGSRDPQKVAGLIYLDAGSFYAFADPSKPFLQPRVPPGAKVSAVFQGIVSGMQEFTKVSTPTLAIVPYPHSPLPPGMTAAKDKASMESQISIIKRDDPTARIMRIPNAAHYVFISSEAAVLSDVHTFIDTLPKS